MPVYSLSAIYNPQYISDSATALTLAPVGGTTVPANQQYQIAVMRVVNVTSAPVSLKMWRVPNGSSDDATHVVVPVTVLVPVATQTFPHFDVTVLWGAVLGAGDAIFAVAGSASALSVSGDGLVITQ